MTDSPTNSPPIATFHLNARVQPVHRGSVYEDPLDELLAQHAPGSSVVGGGTAFTPETGPLSCDTEVQLAGDPGDTLDLVIRILEHLGAPIGSWAQLGGGEKIPFGRTHGFALVLDGTGLPDEVYANNDVNDLIGALQATLGEQVELQSWWEGGEHTALYFYGEDAAHLRAVLASAAELSPLGVGSSVEHIAGA